MKTKLELPEPALKLLVRSLARFETPWRPTRSQVLAPAVHHYRASKSPFTFGGGTGRQRADVNYHLSLLRSAKLIAANGRPTVAGKRIARALTWWFTLPELREALRRLRGCIRRDDVLEDCGEPYLFAPDSLVCGAYWNDQNYLLEKLFLPLLADGHLIAQADAMGQPFYAIASTAAINKAVANLLATYQFDDELSELYEREAVAVKSEIAAFKSQSGEIGECPLPVGELKSKREYVEAVNVEPLFELSDGRA